MSDYRRQLDALIDRELAILRGEWVTAALLIAQAPLIGLFIGLAWRDEEAKAPAFFIMAVAAIWMGCMNACASIVRERPIFERERMFNLSIFAYLHSKLAVLASVSFIQGLLLLAVQSELMRLPGGAAAFAAYLITLTLTGVAATALGLLISACAATTYGAVVAVPVLLIPQILFSELLLKNNIDKPLPGLIENFTLTKWGYEAFLTIGHGDWHWSTLMGSSLALAVAGVLLALLAAARLRLNSL